MICTYQDYAEEEEVETSSLTEKMDQDGTDQIVFPVKLHNMLNQVEKQGLGHGKDLPNCAIVLSPLHDRYLTP